MAHSTPPAVAQTFASHVTSVRAARRFAGTTLTTAGAPASVVRDFELVVSELVANVIAGGGVDELLVIVSAADPHVWEVRIEGGLAGRLGAHADASTWTIAAPDALSGRGLGIVRRLMDDVVVDTSSGEVSITCRRARTGVGTR